MKVIKCIALVLVFLVLAAGGMAMAGTLDEVRARGVVVVGVSTGLAGSGF